MNAPTEQEQDAYTDGWFAVQAVKLANALVEPDRAVLKDQLGELSTALAAGGDPEVTGRLRGLADVARWGLERVVALEAHERFGIGVGTREHRFLALLGSEGPMPNATLRTKLDLDAPGASKVGRTLREAGFVIRRKLGREVFWELTPRGETALRRLDESEQHDSLGRLRSASDKQPLPNDERLDVVLLSTWRKGTPNWSRQQRREAVVTAEALEALATASNEKERV